MPTVDLRDDDALARALGTALHDATGDLAYTGRVPAPRRVPLVALPVAAVGVAGLAYAGLTGGSSRPATVAAPAPTASASPAAPTQTVQPELVRQSLQVAGTTYTYTLAATDEPLYGRPASAVPAGAEPVTTSGTEKAYVAKDASGVWSAYVQPAGGQLFAITSRTATREQLVALLQGAPKPIPYVETPAS